MGREAVAERVQRHALHDPGRVDRPTEKVLSWRVVIGLPCCPRCLLAPTR
jgi:hypothetical protein